MKKIEGYKNYAITEHGRVFNIKRDKEVSQRPCRIGYWRVCITGDDGKSEFFGQKFVPVE